VTVLRLPRKTRPKDNELSLGVGRAPWTAVVLIWNTEILPQTGWEREEKTVWPVAYQNASQFCIKDSQHRTAIHSQCICLGVECPARW